MKLEKNNKIGEYLILPKFIRKLQKKKMSRGKKWKYFRSDCGVEKFGYKCVKRTPRFPVFNFAYKTPLLCIYALPIGFVKGTLHFT